MKKVRLSFTIEELRVLRDRLVPITIADYDLNTYAILRHLYGRFDHIVLMSEVTESLPHIDG